MCNKHSFSFNDDENEMMSCTSVVVPLFHFNENKSYLMCLSKKLNFGYGFRKMCLSKKLKSVAPIRNCHLSRLGETLNSPTHHAHQQSQATVA